MEVVLLKKKDVIDLGIFNYIERIDDGEKAYIAQSLELTKSSKVSLELDRALKWRFNSIVCIGEKYVLNKWLGSNLENLKKDLPRSTSLVFLNDKKTGLPLCIMDGTLISAVRTGVSAVIAVKYLARKEDKVAAVIGTGPIGEECVKALSVLGLEQINITSLDPKLKEIAEELDKIVSCKVVAKDSIEAACKDVPIIVSATTAPRPIIKKEWLMKGFTKISLGGREDEDEVLLCADKIINDNWHHVKKRNSQTVALMFHEGKLKDENIYPDIGHIVSGNVKGRERDDENIYFNAVGLGELDLFVASKIFEKSSKDQKFVF
ncbi:ornithine cyclodeaminase family protein [archaeon]|jgi:N-[(2S)-2-amino-2-carboxyethyl]-L-glutamate dehydrogenase|nr:ornithine cyclodeaminase family protein [archaeon]MBT3730633.1 ornithine cyclodeaminase family protein [archaeon]MBT4669535.1 ornithine cyclodeaminase family protein [archaeon]MBT5030292.1 ornithine cyclodeaminase family protein [archaeon]MBT5288415.1 ornithine cyclodeaminase family protein [archaeon]